MSLLTRLQKWIWLLIIPVILLGFSLRIINITQDLHPNLTHEQVMCLTPTEEQWLYHHPESSSLYGWDRTRELSPTPPDFTQRTALTSQADMLLARLIGALIGVLIIALTISIARKAQSNTMWLLGLLVAGAFWFVASDRWVVQFDFALLCVSLSVWAQYCVSQTWGRSIQGISSIALLLIAPPLFWLVPFLLVRYWSQTWRWAFATFGTMIILLPTLQSPFHWWLSVQQPDIAITATLIWLALIAFVLWQPTWSIIGRLFLSIFVLITTIYSFWVVLTAPLPSLEEWDLIYTLQNTIADGNIVRWDEHTANLAPIVTCSVGANLQFTESEWVVLREYRAGAYPVSPIPHLVITHADNAQDELNTQEVNFQHSVSEFVIGRTINVPNPTRHAFDDLVTLIGYDLPTEVSSQSILRLRLDFQLGLNISPDILGYAYYLQVASTSQRDSVIINHTYLFENFTGQLAPRGYLLNHQIAELVPADAVGDYDIWFGVYNIFTSDRLEGSELLLGQITITELQQ